MRLLLDTNIFLEVILDQAAADRARTVLVNSKAHDLFVTDYAVHSIGLLLFRRGESPLLGKVLDDLLAAGVTLVSVPLQSLRLVAEEAVTFHLDFDDAYQYVAAEINDLQIVSFDSDFDRTERGRMIPGEF